MGVVSLKGSLLLMAFLIHTVLTAPVIEENTALHGPDQIAEGTGCYYNYEHYDEGDRILTNEPCLNCTCHNRMLMCYLRVCPFTKAIGQDCKVEKKPDQCCPVITCPQVPVALLTSSTTETTASTTTAVGHPDSYGCILDDNIFYADGAQVPSDPRKPCELCYCIRNQTACVMQECTLNVEGCKPVYQEGVCCPVRYDCDYDELLTTPRPTAGLVTTPGGPNECKANDQIFRDGEMIENMTENPCEHCYCMRGDVVCAVQECGTPLENTECTPMPAEPGQCCPNTYQCPNGTVPAHVLQATPNLKPSPPVEPSLAQIKPDTETEKPTADKIVEGSETTEDWQESENAEVEQQATEKTDRPSDSNVAESSEVITEAPKEQAIIEIITTAAPQVVAEGQTDATPSEALQTDVEQHPEAQQEISSVPEIVPEHDQIEEGHLEEEHVQEGYVEGEHAEEGHVEDGHEGESHDVEATTAPGHYTEISVENVEMNTSPPEVAKPDIPSASHSLDETESEPVNTEVPHELTTVGPSSPLKEQLPQTENQEVSNQQIEHDGSGQPENQDAISQPENQDAVSQPENQGAVSQPENQDAVSQPENQDAVSQPENLDAVSQPENLDTVNQPENQDPTAKPENQDATAKPENQDATTKPEIQDAISQPENSDAISQPENQDSVSQPENHDAVSQPENQDAISQSEHNEAATQDENQQPTSQPDAQGASIQSEIQETTIQPAIQEVINQLDNQEASSQQEKVQPENQDASSQQVNQESSSQHEIDSTPTEPTPSSQMPEEPLPQENEKISPFNDLPETTPSPVSSTTTTEAEPEEMSRIPGEGSCLHKGITYAPNTEVPSTNACKRCRCINSIVECNDLECPEPPISLYSNCVPMPPTDDACCPTYFCEQKPSQEPEVDSMSIDKIDQGVEEVAPEEGIAPTTVASVHEDLPAVPEVFVPGTHEISAYINPDGDDGSQPESPISEDADEVKPSGGESQPEAVIPSGEGSQPESAISSDGSQPESTIPAEGSLPESTIPAEGSQPESADPSEVSQPESAPVESATEPQAPVDVASVDITTALPEGPSDHQGSTSLDQHEPSEDVQPVSHDNVESESIHDAEATPTTAPLEIIPEEQGSKLEEAQSISEVPQTTAVDDQQLATEIPQFPQHSFDGSEDAHPEPEHEATIGVTSGTYTSTVQPEHEELQESQGSQDAVAINEKVEETIQTTVAPVHEDSAHMENGQETEPQHGDMTNQEETNLGEAHDGQESVTEDESSASGTVNTDAPSISAGEHKGTEHDSEPSGSSQPTEAEHVPTVDQAENDLTANHDQSAQESPTTAIPEETSSIHAEYNEAQLPSTEGPSGASENPEIPEPMVTAGPPVLIPDISHQGAPIHIPGPAGINTDGLTSEDERLGETEAPIQEPSQTEQPQAPEESSSSGDVQQASEVSEGGIKDDIVYTTEGLNVVPHQTEEVANEVVSGVGSEADSGNNQITESSQTSEPGAAHDDVNEISPPEHETAHSGDSQSQVEEVQESEGVEPSTEVSQSVTETPQVQVQHHDETEIQKIHDQTEIQPTHGESEVQPTHDDTEAQQTHDESEAQQTHEETHDEAETHEKPAEQQVVTEAPSVPEKDVTEAEVNPTEAPQAPIVTHGDLPTPSEPSSDNVVPPGSDTELEKQPEPSQTQQSQDAEVSTSQPAVESHGHEEVESESGHPQEVTQAPENDEVVTHIDSAGPQQVPEIANQVVETETNAIEHATGIEHGEEPSAPTEDEKTEADEVAHTAEDHHEPIEQEQPEEPQSIPEEHHSDVVLDEHQEQTDVLPAEHQEQPDVLPAEHQEQPDVVVPTEHQEQPDAVPAEHQEQPDAVPAEHQEQPDVVVPAEHQEQPDVVVPTEHQEQPDAVPAEHQEQPDAVPAEHQEQPDAVPAEHQEQPDVVVPAEHQEQPDVVVPTEHQEQPDAVPAEHQEQPDAVPAEHQEQPAVVPAEHQEQPESDNVPILEDHSEGHTGPYLPGAHNLEENLEQQTEQSVSEIPSEQTQPQPQQPEMAQAGAEQPEPSTEHVSEHTSTAEPQSEPSGPQEETVQTLPEVTHDENQPEQPLVEEPLEQEEPHPEQTLVDNAGASHSDAAVQELPQTTPVPEQQGPSQDTEVQPEQQNVVSGQQVDEEEAKPAISEHQELLEVTGGGQETATQQESGSGQPSTDGQVPQIEENIPEQVPQASHDNAPAATGEEEAQTAAPVVGEIVQTEDVTAAPEHPEVVAASQQPPAEADKDVGITMETTTAVHHEDLQEETHEQPAIPEGQPNESIALSPEVEPSASDLPVTPEEVPVESGPSAPSAPESAPSAPESVAPEEPSAPESVVPELPSAPESVVPELPSVPELAVPDQPSAPEYTAPEQPSAPESEVQPSAPESEVQPSAPEPEVHPSAPESEVQPSAPESEVQPSAPESEVQPTAPEQPVAPETQPSSSGQDEVPAPQESDIPSQPDQSSHLVEEIEKEQPVPETSSSPIAELPQSSPLPPVEIPSTEGPVLPPGLQTWSQKPYHPPSLPEHQQHHHTTAEVPHIPEDSHYPSQPYDQDYEDDDNVSYGPGTCRYGGKVYLSAQQIPRDDPCDFCFCFRSDIICLQQSCPPPIRGCYQETIKGFCCPRYECHVSMATMVNITTTSTTTTTTVPPHFLSHHYNGSAMKAGCQVKGIAYRVGDRIPSTSGPCLDCRCGADGQMKCDPTVCGPQESLLRQVMAASVSKRRRR